MKRRRFVTGIAVTAFAPPLFAADYLAPDEAQHTLFPEAEQFVAVSLARGVAALKLSPARASQLAAYEARKAGLVAGYVVFDQVVGKYELISYAVALSPAAVVRGVEILAYRESHGYEIRQQAWRAQFIGKDNHADIRINDDISNISGATLSCTHVTDGIRQIVALTYASFAAT
jgi:Na+-translocating ferredoxin:NAD+ oxidoreductase RnfG subunit